MPRHIGSGLLVNSWRPRVSGSTRRAYQQRERYLFDLMDLWHGGRGVLLLMLVRSWDVCSRKYSANKSWTFSKYPPPPPPLPPPLLLTKSISRSARYH